MLYDHREKAGAKKNHQKVIACLLTEALKCLFPSVVTDAGMRSLPVAIPVIDPH